MSTQDHHQDMLSRTNLAADLGLAVGALLPCVSSFIVGAENLSADRPELYQSMVSALAGLALLIWIVVAFPPNLYRLPSAVRFAARADDESKRTSPSLSEIEGEAHTGRLLVSGTLFVAVQSAALVSFALWMRDLGMVGGFRQTKAIAAIFCLPAMFAAVASGMCFAQILPTLRQHSKFIAFAITGIVGLLFTATHGAVDEHVRVVCVGLELSLLLVGNAFAGPFNIHRQSPTEDSLATLEWMKAYLGRLAAPVLALSIQQCLGFAPLLIALCCTTCLVAVM